MAWTSPATAVAGDTITAAMFNTAIRDNLNATAVGVATTPGRIIVTNGAGSVLERIPDVAFVQAAQSTLSGTYVDMATFGPSVTVLTGNKVLVSIGALMSNDWAGQGCRCATAISGAHTEPAGDTNSLAMISKNVGDGFQASLVTLHNVAAGFNTFTLKYRAPGAGTPTFANRLMAVVPF